MTQNVPITIQEVKKNLQSWKNKSEDKKFISDVLSKAKNFSIDPSMIIDDSESFHLYPALEQINDESNTYELVIYMISKKNDTEDGIRSHYSDINQIIKKLKVHSIQLSESTEISEEEAIKRVNNWNKKNIDFCLRNNEIFQVFDIPSKDFNLSNDDCVNIGYFGMKESIASEGASLLPDIIIHHIYSSGVPTTFFDMAKLSPPFKSKEYQDEFYLLSLNM